MFQESLVESTPLLRTHNRWPVIISFGMQAAILTLVVAIPLLHPEVIPPQVLNKLNFLPAPRVKPPTPPPQPPVHVQVAPASNAPVAPTTQPPVISTTQTQQFNSDNNPVATPTIAMNPGPATSNVAFTPASAPPAPHVVSAPAAPVGPYHVSEGVLAGYLTAPIRPLYPPIAQVAHVQGVVIIQATISTTGRVENAHIVSGPPLLQGAALDAVRNARYRPYQLNHQPTEVETTFTINFHLGG